MMSDQRCTGSALIDFMSEAPFQVGTLMAGHIEEMRKSPRLDEQDCKRVETRTLRKLFCPEVAATIEGWLKRRFAPYQLCDECGERMVNEVPVEDWDVVGRRYLFCLTPSGFKPHFISEWCEEIRLSSGEEAGLPNIIAKLNPKRANA